MPNVDKLFLAFADKIYAYCATAVAVHEFKNVFFAQFSLNERPEKNL